MRVAEDGKSIDITIEEAYKLLAIGYICECHDGKVVSIHEEDCYDNKKKDNKSIRA